MSKQLSEQLAAQIRAWASANAATRATTFDETRYLGIIDGAWWMAEQLAEAQERIRELERVLENIVTVTKKSDYLAANRIAKEALSPNNKDKEDEKEV